METHLQSACTIPTMVEFCTSVATLEFTFVPQTSCVIIDKFRAQGLRVSAAVRCSQQTTTAIPIACATSTKGFASLLYRTFDRSRADERWIISIGVNPINVQKSHQLKRYLEGESAVSISCSRTGKIASEGCILLPMSRGPVVTVCVFAALLLVRCHRRRSFHRHS